MMACPTRRTECAVTPFGLEQPRRRTLAAGTAHLVVQRAIRWPGHCGIDGEVREQALDDFVAEIARGSNPAVMCWRLTRRNWSCAAHLSSTRTILHQSIEQAVADTNLVVLERGGARALRDVRRRMRTPEPN